jgi:hypothetical protein
MLPVQVLARLHQQQPIKPLRKRARMQGNKAGAAAVEEDTGETTPTEPTITKIQVSNCHLYILCQN